MCGPAVASVRCRSIQGIKISSKIRRFGHNGERPMCPPIGLDPGVLGVAMLQQQEQIGDRDLRVLQAIDEQHRRGWLIQQSERLQRERRSVVEDIIERTDAGTRSYKYSSVRDDVRCQSAWKYPWIGPPCITIPPMRSRSAYASRAAQ
jgi:hypothetical protein